MRINIVLFSALLLWTGCESDNTGASATGQGGSMTRFAIQDSYMYVADNSSIQVFGIDQGQFTKRATVPVDLGLETIFAKGEYLYLGASDAMYIYSIANPEEPTFIFCYQHIVSCDPVVVQGNRAYVTFSSGNACNRGVNALEIVDISNPMEPSLVKNYPMASPRGLAIDGNLLFICEGNYGLTVWDVSDEQQIKLIEDFHEFFAYDVIAKSGLATVTGEDGIFQYAYNEDGSGITLLSKISVTRAGG